MIINVIGSGTWGTTIAQHLSNNGYDVVLYYRNSQNSKKLVNDYIHPNLSHYRLSDKISFSLNLSEIKDNSLNIIAVPSNALSDIFEKDFNTNGKFLILSKGFDINTGLLPTELLQNKFNINPNNLAVLSGPNHAEEIINNMPCATTIASKNLSYCLDLQKIISSNVFRVYTSDDVLGVQVGGAIKNTIAIASGLCSGLQLGDNILAALVSRGMNEIISLVKIYDIELKTLSGLSGLGDLIATCYSKHSRNRQLGFLIGKGMSLQDAKNKIGMVSEGVNTTKILDDISKKNNIELPICNKVYEILYEGADPKKSFEQLMSRSLKKEN